MAILRKKETKNMNLAELGSRLKDLRLELLKANAQKASKSAANAKINEIKKTIARILTEINQKKLSEKASKPKKGKVSVSFKNKKQEIIKEKK